MSEKPSISPERHRHIESKPTNEHKRETKIERHVETQAEKTANKAKVEALSREASQEAVSGKDVSVEDNPSTPSQIMINKELKLVTLKRTLSEVRQKLTKPEKSLSKFIHQPTVDKLSRVGEKTLVRPSGILGAGLIALIGSTMILYVAKRHGFSYNLSVFFILLLAGYLVGLFIEFLMRLTHRKR